MSANSNTSAQDIRSLRQWISKKPHLPQDHEKFLKGCKYSIERCKETIDNYYTTRTLLPEFFSDRDPTSDEMKSVGNIERQLYLPNTTPEGYTVWIVSSGDYNKTNTNSILECKHLMMLCDAHLYLESSEEWIIIYDAKYDTSQTFSDITPSLLKKCFLGLTNRPIRIKQIHVINTSFWFVKFVEIFKMFCSEKLKSRIFIHGTNFEDLYKYIPKEILPNEYGGKAGLANDLNDKCQNELEKIRDWFLIEETKKTDESKRPAEMKSKLLEDSFGVDGSFRKLDVD